MARTRAFVGGAAAVRVSLLLAYHMISRHCGMSRWILTSCNSGCSIWAVELIRREILRAHPEATNTINAVLIDFFLYDLAKEREAQGMSVLTRPNLFFPLAQLKRSYLLRDLLICRRRETRWLILETGQHAIPHHRTRSIWY